MGTYPWRKKDTMFDNLYDERRLKEVKIATAWIACIQLLFITILVIAHPSFWWALESCLAVFTFGYIMNWLRSVNDKKEVNSEVMKFCWITLEGSIQKQAYELAFKVTLAKSNGIDQARLLLKSIAIALTIKIDISLINSLLSEELGEHFL